MTMTTCLTLDIVMQSSPVHSVGVAMSGPSFMARSGEPLEPLPQPPSESAAAAAKGRTRREVIPSSYQGQWVVHIPVSQVTVTRFIAQLFPSSASVGCAAQPHAAQVASQAVSAVVNASRCAWLKPTPWSEPQQSTWWKPSEQLSVVVQPLSKVGNVVVPPHIPGCGAGQVFLLHAVPAVQVAPLATHLRFAGSQQPLPQSAPLQHASPGPPQVTQVPSPQARPDALHASPAQQGWPAPPHTEQTGLSPPPLQATPSAVQVRPEQQGWPAAPQATQVVAEQVTPLPVQVVRPLPPALGSVQHIWLDAPQVPQLPSLQVPPMLGHAEPDATQVRSTQQPPLEQPLPGQQGWPGPPHCAHNPLLQALPSAQSPPAQQVCPGAPHAAQVSLLVQLLPDSQLRSAQQAPPADPQFLKAALFLVQAENANRTKTA